MSAGLLRQKVFMVGLEGDGLLRGSCSAVFLEGVAWGKTEPEKPEAHKGRIKKKKKKSTLETPDYRGLERKNEWLWVGVGQILKDLVCSIPNFSLMASHLLFWRWELSRPGMCLRTFIWHPSVSCFKSGMSRETNSEQIFCGQGKVIRPWAEFVMLGMERKEQFATNAFLTGLRWLFHVSKKPQC